MECKCHKLLNDFACCECGLNIVELSLLYKDYMVLLYEIKDRINKENTHYYCRGCYLEKFQSGKLIIKEGEPKNGG